MLNIIVQQWCIYFNLFTHSGNGDFLQKDHVTHLSTPNLWQPLLFVLFLKFYLFQNIIQGWNHIVCSLFGLAFHLITSIYIFPFLSMASQFITFQYGIISFVWMYHYLFILSPTKEHFDCFRFSICEQSFHKHLCSSFHVDCFQLLAANTKECDCQIVQLDYALFSKKLSNCLLN